MFFFYSYSFTTFILFCHLLILHMNWLQKWPKLHSMSITVVVNVLYTLRKRHARHVLVLSCKFQKLILTKLAIATTSSTTCTKLQNISRYTLFLFYIQQTGQCVQSQFSTLLTISCILIALRDLVKLPRWSFRLVSGHSHWSFFGVKFLLLFYTDKL